MLYKFIDDLGAFTINDPQKYPGLYFPLTDAAGKILCAISPGLCGDIKSDNEHFLTLPASIEDLRSNPLCRREFFIQTAKETFRLSQAYADRLEAGLLYQNITKTCGRLKVEILNFVPADKPVEVMRLTVTNTSRKPQIITPTSFIPIYGRSQICLRDHRHVSSLLNRVELNRYGIILKPTMVFDEKNHHENFTEYFVLGCEDNGNAPIGQFPTLDSFYGSGDIFSPDAVTKKIRPYTKTLEAFAGKETCAGLRFQTRTLRPGQSVTYILLAGISTCLEPKKAFSALNSRAKVEQALQKTKQYWQSCLSAIALDFPDKDFRGWLKWVKLQPTLRKLFGCSFLPHFDYGKGGRGWRDLWQDALTLLLTDPPKARDIIEGSFAGIRLDGSNATIITSDGFSADRNSISRVWMDHGVWPLLTLNSYIQRTGDIAILLRETTYFRDHQLKRAKERDLDFDQPDFIQRGGNDRPYHAAILEHVLVQTLVQFFNVGEHNCVKLENADWNDGLDMAADRGESVAFSFQYCHNLKLLAGLLTRLKTKTAGISLLSELTLLLDNPGLDYDDWQTKQNRLQEYLRLTKTISGEKKDISLDTIISDLEKKYDQMNRWLASHEWLKEGFFNSYYDNKGQRLGGMTLTGQVFATMSGIASDEQIKQTWASIKKHLFDKRLGGFRLNTDFGTVLMDLGRAFGFSYGDKENGAVFSHMAVMLANALYKRGFIREGFETLDSLYKMATKNSAGIPPVLPEYFNSQGKGLYLYLTGSASWYIYTLWEEVLGVKFSWGDLNLSPKLVPEYFAKKNEIKIKFSWLNKTVEVVYQKESANPVLQLFQASLNGQLLDCRDNTCLISADSVRKMPGSTIQIIAVVK